jgi:hypothetical protein
VCTTTYIGERVEKEGKKKREKKVAGRGQSSCLLALGFAREIMFSSGFKELVHTTIFMGGRYSTIPQE